MGELANVRLEPGTLIGERYRVISRIGSGGMGTVYKVEHVGIAKEMALKLLPLELSTIPDVAQRFEREAKAIARLDHPNVVRVTDFGSAPGAGLFMVMDLVAGRPLSAIVEEKGQEPARAVAIIDQVLAALEHAHGMGVVHRDVKPANVMVTEKDAGLVVKLLDFGIAKIVEDPAAAPATPEAPLTRAGMTLGTPRYMSPEQACGEPADARSDIYSTGCVLYETLVGQPPFLGLRAVEVLGKHVKDPPPPLSLGLADRAMESRLDAVIHRAMEKAPEKRFQTASEFRSALSEALRGPTPTTSLPAIEPVSVPPPSFWDRPRALVRRASVRRQAAMVGAGVISLALLIAALFAAFEPRGADPGLIERASQALSRGDLPAARAVIAQAQAQAPADPRVALLEGHVAFAESAVPAAVRAYKRAVEADPSSAEDAVLQANLRREVSKGTSAALELVALLSDKGPPAVAPFLAELAGSAPGAKARREAFRGLERLGKTDLLDLVAYLGEELVRNAGASCETRKGYVERLLKLEDPRILPILKREAARRGGFLNLSSANECMERELREQITRLDKKDAPK